MEQIRISGKDLGQMALASFCPRCFWIKRHHRLPYQIFPGIFSSLDSYSKRLTWSHFTQHHTLPPWFQEHGIHGEPIKIPAKDAFSIIDEESNIRLTGIPDEILKNDEGYIIVDYKTARYTGNQDELLPMYQVQLNAYAYIAERTGLAPVTKLWLLYHEPHTNIDNSDDWCSGTSFLLRFDNTFKELKRLPDLIPALLRQFRAIYDQPLPPRMAEGCKDCNNLNAIAENLSGTEEE